MGSDHEEGGMSADDYVAINDQTLSMTNNQDIADEFMNLNQDFEVKM